MPLPIQCEICGRTPQEGISVYRINPKGEDGIWRCEEHLRQHKVDPETKFIVDIFEKRKD